jgi:hypothetical protein
LGNLAASFAVVFWSCVPVLLVVLRDAAAPVAPIVLFGPPTSEEPIASRVPVAPEAWALLAASAASSAVPSRARGFSCPSISNKIFSGSLSDLVAVSTVQFLRSAESFKLIAKFDMLVKSAA